MNLGNCLDSIQVIDTGIKTNLVHDDNSGLLCLFVKFAHSRRDLGRRNNMCLALDSGFDDSRVISVRNERDDQFICGDFLLQSFGVVNVKRDGSRIRETFRETLGRSKSSASW